jgi:hypothetical protein
MEQTDMIELSLGFARLAEEISGGSEADAPLQRIVDLAVKYMDGCRYCTITSVRGGRKYLLASSDAVGEQLVQLQNDLGEGPGLDAAGLTGSYLISDLITEKRWPRFAALATRATNVRSVLAFRLAGTHPSILSMYSESTDGFTDEELSTATIFASHASTLVALLAAEDHSANLETALQSSREIGMALGILMAHRKVTDDAAFDLLRTASQNLHRKLRDVASEVMETGTLPDLPPKRPAS